MRYLFVLCSLAACKMNTPPPPQAAKGGAIRGTIEIKADLKDKVQPTDVVYIIARKAAAGPPLAVKRVVSPTFPLSYELTEKDVMMGGPFEGDVDLTVRVDKDGDAMSKNPGDLVGKATAKVGDGAANVTIDQTL
jgi:cytochrome c-type biogenesis protein CcmH